MRAQLTVIPRRLPVFPSPQVLSALDWHRMLPWLPINLNCLQVQAEAIPDLWHQSRKLYELAIS